MTGAMIAMLQTPEIIGLLVLALIFFGAKKLPELARGLGSGIREFRKATRDVTDEIQSVMDADSTPTRRPIAAPESQPMTPGAEGSVAQYPGAESPGSSSENLVQSPSSASPDAVSKTD